MHYDFSDILIQPAAFSQVGSRGSVDLHVKGFIPVSASNMETIGTFEVADRLASYGLRTYIDKHRTLGEWREFLRNSPHPEHAIPTFGCTHEDIQKAKDHWSDRVTAIGPCQHTVCFDVANGHSLQNLAAVMEYLKARPIEHLIYGNIANPAAIPFINGKIDDMKLPTLKSISYKVGIGSGSVCTTRLMTGVGVPQYTLVEQCAEKAKDANKAYYFDTRIISDGGCRNPGDVLKAFVAGADEVILGGMFAGTHETGTSFYGSSSAASKSYDPLKKHCTPEGKSVTIDRNKSLHKVVTEITGGLRSGLSYIDCSSLKELIDNSQAIRALVVHVNRQVDNYS